jgi:hypothetical protein
MKKISLMNKGLAGYFAEMRKNILQKYEISLILPPSPQHMKTRQPTPEQKAAAAERRAALAALAKQAAALPMEGWAVATIEGHPLSFKNAALAALQRPNVSLVGGFQQWRKAGRMVRKGEKAIGIFLPLVRTSDDGEAAGLAFRVVNVFDISQTEEAAA